MNKLLLFFVFSLLSLEIIAQNEQVIFKEDFSNNNRNWPLGYNSGVTSSIIGEKYQIQSADPTYSLTNQRVLFNSGNHYLISISVNHISGSIEKEYGLLFGNKDNKNFYVFALANSNQFRIWQADNGALKELAGWTYSSAIKAGNNQDNKLTLENKSPEWKFYINDQLVTTLPAKNLYGYGVGAIFYGAQTIAVDDIVIKGTPATETILLNEDFSTNKRNWQVINDGLESRSVVDGKYTMVQKIATNFPQIELTRVYIDQNNDYDISVDITHLSGKNDCGIIFGYHDNETDGITNSYLLMIGPMDNMRYLEKRENGKTINLIVIDHSYSIRTGKNGKNTLRLSKKGTTWEFYINNVLAGSCLAENFLYDNVGLVVSGQDKSNFEFDNLIIKETSARLETTVIEDHFTNNYYQWKQSIDETGTSAISNGKLIIKSLPGFAKESNIDVHLESSSDFSIRVSANHTSGMDSLGYGFYFDDLNGVSNFIMISSSGFYNFLVARDDGKGNATTIASIPWTECSAIKKGNNNPNILTIKRVNEKLVLFINSEFVASIITVKGGIKNLGLIADGDQTVEFGDLQITKYDN